MPRDIVEIANVEIDSPTLGKKELTTVTSLSIDDTNESKPMKTMNRKRRAIGYTRGVPDFKFDLEVALEALATPEVDWKKLQQTGEIFQISYEENAGGSRFTLKDCRVGSVKKSFNENGETKLSVSCMALDHVEE